VSFQHLFRSGGGDVSPASPPVSTTEHHHEICCKFSKLGPKYQQINKTKKRWSLWFCRCFYLCMPHICQTYYSIHPRQNQQRNCPVTFDTLSTTQAYRLATQNTPLAAFPSPFYKQILKIIEEYKITKKELIKGKMKEIYKRLKSMPKI